MALGVLGHSLQRFASRSACAKLHGDKARIQSEHKDR